MVYNKLVIIIHLTKIIIEKHDVKIDFNFISLKLPVISMKLIRNKIKNCHF